jgi:rod shape determining protein RodA
MEAARPAGFSTGGIGLFDPRHVKRLDWILAGLTLMLVAVGLLNMYSATYGDSSGVAPVLESRSLLDALRDSGWWFGRQSVYFIAGAVAALALACIDYRIIISLSPVFYVGTLVVLGLVLEFGELVNGARRWLDLGVVRLQPSEFTKIVLVYFLAWYLAKLGPRIRGLHWFALTFVLGLLPCGLILLQPSLSAALVLPPIVFVMLFAAGARLWHLGAVVLAALAPIAMVWAQLGVYQELLEKHRSEADARAAFEATPFPLGLKLEPYQLDRIMMFRNPERDPKDKGYQSIQMRTTVGSGEVLGKGFGKGTQTHLQYLPYYHTDMIYALLAEEWGFIGSTAVIVLLSLLLIRGLIVAERAPDDAGRLICAGAATILGFHAFTNMAITLGMLPVTGMPLPFLSYGGSFAMTTMLCVGAILSVHVRRRLAVP